MLDKISPEDRNACYTNEHGTLEWTTTEDTYGGISSAVVITWNANGLRKAVRTGALAQFLNANTDADVININETKCSPASLPRVWEFRAAMTARAEDIDMCIGIGVLFQDGMVIALGLHGSIQAQASISSLWYGPGSYRRGRAHDNTPIK